MSYEFAASVLQKEEDGVLSTITTINTKGDLVPYKSFIESEGFLNAGKFLVDKANASKQLRSTFDAEKLSQCVKGATNIEYVLSDEISHDLFAEIEDILVKDSFLMENGDHKKLIIVFTTKSMINLAKSNPVQLKGITICFNSESDVIEVFIDDSPPSKVLF